MNLFFDDEAEEQAASADEFPDIPDCTPKVRLAMEKEAAGIYLTGHPLEEYQEQLSYLEVNARFLSASAEEKEDGGLLLIDLPGAKEGDVLVETENGFAVDPEATIARRERMLARTRKIRRRRER